MNKFLPVQKFKVTPYSNYKKNYNKDNENKIFKCQDNRKDEYARSKNHLGAFCNATLKTVKGFKNSLKGYYVNIITPHTLEYFN